MSSFSQRKGLKPIKVDVQINSMDYDLRIGLWNVLLTFFWHKAAVVPPIYREVDRQTSSLLTKLCRDYFKRRLDEMNFWEIMDLVKKYFFECEWHEVYDITEFVARNDPYGPTHVSQFMKSCNETLERELSAYRFVGGMIAQVTSDEEIGEIEQALGTPVSAVNVHLKTALTLLSDKKSPDYRNSIKESVSAVEALCRQIAKDDATLGQALKKVKEKVPLHPALEKAFAALYGYASSAKGIRHSLLEEGSDLDFADAKFMLVSCSAFINYLVYKAGIELGSIA